MLVLLLLEVGEPAVVEAAQDLKKELCREFEDAGSTGCCSGQQLDALRVHGRAGLPALAFAEALILNVCRLVVNGTRLVG